MSSWSPTKYKTKNWRSYNSALRQRGSLSIWFDPEMSWHAPPTGKRGRQLEFSDAAIQICLTMKVLFGMPLRQTTGFVESLLRLAGLDWKFPDFSTLCRRQKTLNVAIPYRGGTGPLHLLIDATGIKAEGEGEWNARKHGGCHRAKRSCEGVQVSWTSTMAKTDRISPPKPRRDKDELRQTPWPRPHGSGLRPASCRATSSDRGAQSLYSSRHPHHRARRISPSGVRRSALKTRFVQQSPGAWTKFTPGLTILVRLFYQFREG